MFKLKRLELLGFKSFADRTRLEFGDGTVGIVGPNGCGKSNLADAINWVLGEQSARLLRGERMADVIFSGTNSRLPTGMAEASITLEDPEFADMDGSGELPAERLDSGMPEGDSPADAASESTQQGDSTNTSQSATLQERLRSQAGQITVTRRLFRSGESEYLINGETCRLRDIQDIFMGTGLGPESYAIIEQGRIGQILSSKPSDRRLILEEAAGISKFKTRKRAAELKLESSRQNLSRITDILDEVTKQVNSLKRQASKARRFRELQEQLTGRLSITLASRLKALDGECGRLRQVLETLGSQCEGSARELELLEREQKTATARAEELESQLTALRETAARTELEKQRMELQIEQMRQQSSSLGARAADTAAETERLGGIVRTLETEAAEAGRRRESLEAERTAADETTRDLLAAHEDLAARIAASEKALEASRAGLLDVVGTTAALKNELTQIGESALALDRRQMRLEAERAAAEAERGKLAAELDHFVSDNQNHEGELANLTKALEGAALELELARQAEDSARAQLESLRHEHSGAEARKQALEESLARHAYSTESVRRLLASESGSNGHRFRPMGVLADFLEVSAGYEEVVEEFLGAQLDCVVVEAHEEARSGIALLRQEGVGRSTFFVTRLPSNGNGHSALDGAHGDGNGNGNGSSHDAVRGEQGVLASVRELVRFAPRLGLNGDLPLPSLASAYMVEDGVTAERLAVAYPESHFLTPTGEHYHHRLISGGRGKNAGPLALRRDFRELERRTRDLDAELRRGEKALADAEIRASELEQERGRLTAAKLEAEKTLLLTNEKVRQTREALDRAVEHFRVVDTESQALAAERAALISRREELRASLEAAAAEKIRQEELASQIAEEVQSLRQQFGRTAQELARAQAAASALDERARSIDAEHSRMESEIRETAARRAQLENQIEIWKAEQRRLADEITQSLDCASALESEQRAAREQVRMLAEETQAVRARRDECGPRVEEARATFETHRGKRSEAEVALARAESDRGHHAGQCREALREEPEVLLAALAPEVTLEGAALESAEAEVRELKARIENLGPLNMMALEELQEAEERYGFLETQRQDLLTSIEETAEAIREIDRVSRQQFLEAFKAINQNFAETFRILFGGGIGQMRLADENDPESGLDIAAQPPGKRLQNVLLLSGGEKALAALALLIAIFRYTPSPFCVLDEVDAPLDESNVDRFNRLIRDMGRHTQFILITHNKRTMETARALYGVTMEDPGVSKLVSVRFEESVEESIAVAS